MVENRVINKVDTLFLSLDTTEKSGKAELLAAGYQLPAEAMATARQKLQLPASSQDNGNSKAKAAVGYRPPAFG